MGHRANLIVVSEAPGYELYYTHWGASTLDSSLFWGPERALAFMRRQRPVAEGADWLDEVWAEGGAVLDLKARKLIWFGGEDVQLEVLLRRVHLGIMRELWAGWHVEWASAGVADLARYVGVPVEPLLRRFVPYDPVLQDPDEPAWISYVVSLREHGRFKIQAQDGDPFELALCGPKLLGALRAATLPDRYDYAARSSDFPCGGVHVDADATRIDVWCAYPNADPVRRLRDAWPVWEVAWHFDRYEAVGEVLGDRLVLPAQNANDLVANVRSIVLRPPRNRGGVAHEVGRRLAAKGREVSISPFALRDDPPDPPDQNAARTFDEAVARWRARTST